MAGIGAEGELGDDEKRTVYIADGTVGFAIFVGENAQSQHFFGDPFYGLFGIAFGHADQNQVTLADGGDGFVIYGYAGVLYALNYCFHFVLLSFCRKSLV